MGQLLSEYCAISARWNGRNGRNRRIPAHVLPFAPIIAPTPCSADYSVAALVESSLALVELLLVPADDASLALLLALLLLSLLLLAEASPLALSLPLALAVTYTSPCADCTPSTPASFSCTT